MSICFLFGMFYSILNVYWFRKVVRKVRRRLQGHEKLTEKNDLADINDEETRNRKKQS